MKNLVAFFVLFGILVHSQTYELSGSPINTSGWMLVADAVAEDDFIRLTSDHTWQNGAVNLQESIQLNSCDKWRVEFDFRIDGNGTSDLKMGDGIAFWYIANPPTRYEQGAGLGIPQDAVGLMVGFDTFNNSNNGQMSKIHILYGKNSGNIEFNNTPGSTFHTEDLQSSQPFVGSTYRHVTVTGERAPSNPQHTKIKLWLDGILLVDYIFSPSGTAATMAKGYFGFSASTGGASSRHSVKNVKVYVDRVQISTKDISPVLDCPDSESGMLTFSLKSLESQMLPHPENFKIDYFESTGAAITDPENYTFSRNQTVIAVVNDPNLILCSSEVKIHLNGDFIQVKKGANLKYCGTDGVGIYNLKEADVSDTAGLSTAFYEKDRITKIDHPEAYETETFDEVFARLALPSGCFRYAKIQLIYQEKVTVQNDSLKVCTPSWDTETAVFDLSKAHVTNATHVTVTYHQTPEDAAAGSGIINNFKNFPASSRYVFARVVPANGCYSVAQIKLKAAKPVQIAQVQVKGNQITVTAVGGEAPLQYTLDGGEWQYSNVFTVEEGGAHLISAKDDNACNTAEYALVMFNLPNVITPNGDGKNDVVDFSLLAGKSHFHFEIFDRYNRSVFSSRTSGQSFWDATLNRKKLPTGTYWYSVSWNEADFAQTQMKYTGWIYVKN